MQFLDNDSSDWVRKAAEDYPVKPIGMDWDAVSKQLNEEEPVKRIAGYALLRYAAMIISFMLLSLVLNKYLRLDFDKRYAGAPVNNNQPKTTNDAVAHEIVTNNKNSGPSVNIGDGGRKWSVPSVVNDQGNVGVNNGVVSEQLTDLDKKTISAIGANEVFGAGLDYKKAFVLSTSQIDLLSNNKLVKENPAIEPSPEAQPNKKGMARRGVFYAGMLMGPDFSTVKMQKSNGLGYNFGILLGYKISPKWQLESGVLINHKTYYSDGEYFNIEKSYLPQHTLISKVDGYCNMFEIPVNIRYNISQKNQSSWFATAGISSYLMNKEDYNITYSRYNVEYTGNKVYYNGANNWLTAVNASVGFEKAVNQKLHLRIEPYLRLPLKGMGTGRLPISSGGLNLGASYPIK